MYSLLLRKNQLHCEIDGKNKVISLKITCNPKSYCYKKHDQATHIFQKSVQFQVEKQRQCKNWWTKINFINLNHTVRWSPIWILKIWVYKEDYHSIKEYRPWGSKITTIWSPINLGWIRMGSPIESVLLYNQLQSVIGIRGVQKRDQKDKYSVNYSQLLGF